MKIKILWKSINVRDKYSTYRKGFHNSRNSWIKKLGRIFPISNLDLSVKMNNSLKLARSWVEISKSAAKAWFQVAKSPTKYIIYSRSLAQQRDFSKWPQPAEARIRTSLTLEAFKAIGKRGMMGSRTAIKTLRSVSKSKNRKQRVMANSLTRGSSSWIPLSQVDLGMASKHQTPKYNLTSLLPQMI